MAHSNNRDRAGPHARAPHPKPAADPGLPWADPRADAHSGGQAYDDQHGYEPALGNLPWPPQPVHPQAQQHAQQGHYSPAPPPPNYPQHNGYAPSPYGVPLPPMQGYPQQSGYAPPNYQGSHYAEAPAPDPHGYELGGYTTAPPYAQQGSMPNHSPIPPPGYGQSFGHAPHHAQNQGYGQPPLPVVATDAEGQDYDEAYDDDEDYEDEDPPRRFGFLKITATFLVAIVVGGGAAYGYKMFGASWLGNRAPLILKADATPAKSQLTDGQQTASTGTVQTDAGAGGSPLPNVVPTDDGGSNGAPAGARKVQTIAITPGGDQPPGAPPIRPTLTMPGLAIEGGATPVPPAPPQAPAATAKTTTRPAQAQPPAAPVAPKAMAMADTPPPPAAPPKKAVAVAKAPPPKSSDAYSPTGAPVTAAVVTTAPAAKSAGNGFVAVLFSSTGDAVAARKELDALQTKYPDVLGSKPTDVTPYTKPDGTAYLRGIVGPPGSRQAAAQVCAQLKTLGHTDCFVTAY
jgi:hypothetical protein